MTICRRCNRPLKREPYRSLGIGKICAAKEDRDTKMRQNDGDSDEIVSYDGGDFFIERLASPTINERGNLEIMKHSCSGIRTNVKRSIYRHSPTGFNFGYGGSGPADFALNLLLMVTDNATANRLYQEFKWDFVGAGENDRLVIKRPEVDNWLQLKKEQLPISTEA